MVTCHAGFNISLTPSFSASRLAFMLGYNAVFAVANLRCHFTAPSHPILYVPRLKNGGLQKKLN